MGRKGLTHLIPKKRAGSTPIEKMAGRWLGQSLATKNIYVLMKLKIKAAAN